MEVQTITGRLRRFHAAVYLRLTIIMCVSTKEPVRYSHKKTTPLFSCCCIFVADGHRV